MNKRYPFRWHNLEWSLACFCSVILINAASRNFSEYKWYDGKKQSKVLPHVLRRYTGTVLSGVGERYRSKRAWYTSPDSNTGCPEF